MAAAKGILRIESLACRPVNPGGRPPLRRPVSGVWLPMTVLLALSTEAVPKAVLEEPTVLPFGSARRGQAAESLHL